MSDLFSLLDPEPEEPEPAEKPRWLAEREARYSTPEERERAAEGARRADDAVEQVGEAADPTWRRVALLAVEAVAVEREEFSTDHVWTYLEGCGVKTHEPRALGAIMRSARAKAVAAATDRYVPSTRPECHARPVRVWRSKVYATGD